MSHINIAILHGIGKNEIGYADHLIKGIETEFNHCFNKRNKPAGDIPTLRFRPIVWDDILDKNQGQLKTILERVLEQKKRETFLGFWTPGGWDLRLCACIINCAPGLRPNLSWISSAI